MIEYINKKDLLSKICGDCQEPDKECWGNCVNHHARMAIQEAKVTNIVRCKDCIYGRYDPDMGDYDCNKVNGVWFSHDGDWFCSDGREKE